MRKKTVAVLVLLLLCLWATAAAEPERETDELMESYSAFYGAAFEEAIGENELLPETGISGFLQDLMQGKAKFSPAEIGRSILSMLFGEVMENMRMLALLLALSLLCGMLRELKDDFGKTGVGMTAYQVCDILIVAVASAAFYQAAKGISEASGGLATFLNFLIPVSVTALIAGGAVLSAGVLEPMLLTVSQITVTVIQALLIPLTMIGAALGVVNRISEKPRITGLVKLFRGTVKWGLGIMLTVFVGAVAMQSVIAGGADGMSTRLTKYATANLIPVVGGVLSETVGTVLRCSVVIKNAVGICGIVCLIAITLMPLLKAGAILIIFRLCAGIAENFAEAGTVACIRELGDGVAVLMGILATVTVAFILILTVIMHAGNTAVWMGG